MDTMQVPIGITYIILYYHRGSHEGIRNVPPIQIIFVTPNDFYADMGKHFRECQARNERATTRYDRQKSLRHSKW